MLTKDDFLQKIESLLPNYPRIAALHRVQDPQCLQMLEAMATMLSMISQNIEVAYTEPFEKVRDSTVLADAAMRGIIRKGTPTRAKVRVENDSEQNLTIDASRTLLDSAGNIWEVASPATIEAKNFGYVEVIQRVKQTITHTVEDSCPFYAIQLPEPEDGAFLATVSVSDSEGPFEYRERYVNTENGERVFNIEADDKQNLYVRFGFGNVVGFQPENGTNINLEVTFTLGEIDLQEGSPFSLEYVNSPLESQVKLTLEQILQKGQNPISMTDLRELAKYPSIYSHNAVFLGEFDFLIRRNFPTLKFLSVWNEAEEELARGANVDNINCLFVACLSQTGDEAVAEGSTDPDSHKVKELAEEIDHDEITETQKSIERVILAADDSYSVRFYKPLRIKIQIEINATISTSYIASDVKEQIVQALLDEYGETSSASKRGQMQVLYRRIYELLREKVPALADGKTDWTVSINDPSQGITRPELWRFVDQNSLTVTVATSNIITPTWGL